MGRDHQGGTGVKISQSIVTVDLAERSYRILVGNGTDSAPDFLRPHLEGKTCMIVTDSTVAPLHLDRTVEMLRKCGPAKIEPFVFPAGEESKHLGTILDICRAGAGAGLDRKSILIALGGSVRSSAYPMLLLPYILIFMREKNWKKRFLLWGLAALPTVIVLLASNAFNWAVFGSPFRTGYHFWCPVPYDFMTLTFHPRYAARYLPRLVSEKGFWLTMALLAICAVWFYASRKAGKKKLWSLPRWTAWEAAMAFALLQSAIIFVLYIVYFFYDKRMYLPILVMVLPPAASAAAHLLRMVLKKRQTV